MIFGDQRLSYIFEGIVAYYKILRPVYACLDGERAAEQGMNHECFRKFDRLGESISLAVPAQELYRQMEGMELREMDQIIDPVYILCRDHERAGFVDGIKIGIMLEHELG